MIRPKTEEDRRQQGFLTTPYGAPGSGRTRYAAAMYFYGRDMIDAGTLEAYRICSPFDGEDPTPLAAALSSLLRERSMP